MSSTNLNVGGKRVKMSATYWRWFCGREPRVGDRHVSDGMEYVVAEITESGTVILSRRNIKRGYT